MFKKIILILMVFCGFVKADDLINYKFGDDLTINFNDYFFSGYNEDGLPIDSNDMFNALKNDWTCAAGNIQLNTEYDSLGIFIGDINFNSGKIKCAEVLQTSSTTLEFKEVLINRKTQSPDTDKIPSYNITLGKGASNYSYFGTNAISDKTLTLDNGNTLTIQEGLETIKKYLEEFKKLNRDTASSQQLTKEAFEKYWSTDKEQRPLTISTQLTGAITLNSTILTDGKTGEVVDLQTGRLNFTNPRASLAKIGLSDPSDLSLSALKDVTGQNWGPMKEFWDQVKEEDTKKAMEDTIAKVGEYAQKATGKDEADYYVAQTKNLISNNSRTSNEKLGWFDRLFGYKLWGYYAYYVENIVNVSKYLIFLLFFGGFCLLAGQKVFTSIENKLGDDSEKEKVNWKKLVVTPLTYMIMFLAPIVHTNMVVPDALILNIGSTDGETLDVAELSEHAKKEANNAADDAVQQISIIQTAIQTIAHFGTYAADRLSSATSFAYALYYAYRSEEDYFYRTKSEESLLEAYQNVGFTLAQYGTRFAAYQLGCGVYDSSLKRGTANGGTGEKMLVGTGIKDFASTRKSYSILMSFDGAKNKQYQDQLIKGEHFVFTVEACDALRTDLTNKATEIINNIETLYTDVANHGFKVGLLLNDDGKDFSPSEEKGNARDNRTINQRLAGEILASNILFGWIASASIPLSEGLHQIKALKNSQQMPLITAQRGVINGKVDYSAPFNAESNGILGNTIYKIPDQFAKLEFQVTSSLPTAASGLAGMSSIALTPTLWNLAPGFSTVQRHVGKMFWNEPLGISLMGTWLSMSPYKNNMQEVSGHGFNIVLASWLKYRTGSPKELASCLGGNANDCYAKQLFRGVDEAGRTNLYKISERKNKDGSTYYEKVNYSGVETQVANFASTLISIDFYVLAIKIVSLTLISILIAFKITLWFLELLVYFVASPLAVVWGVISKEHERVIMTYIGKATTLTMTPVLIVISSSLVIFGYNLITSLYLIVTSMFYAQGSIFTIDGIGNTVGNAANLGLAGKWMAATALNNSIVLNSVIALGNAFMTFGYLTIAYIVIMNCTKWFYDAVGVRTTSAMSSALDHVGSDLMGKNAFARAGQLQH